MIVWSDLFDYLLPEVNGLPPDLAEFHFRRVAIEFCSETLVHQTTLPSIDVIAGNNTYDMVSNLPDTETIQVRKVWFKNSPLEAVTLDAVQSLHSNWGTHTAEAPRVFTQVRPDRIHLWPIPDVNAENALLAQVTVTPTPDAAGLEDWIADHYADDIACGVKARLMAMANRPWTDSERSAYYRTLFERAKGAAKVDVNRNFTRTTLAVALRPFAR